MIFVSTGGFLKQKASVASENLLKAGIENIELSGGTHFSNYRQELELLKIKYPSASFQVHNYFPPPSTPFVFNLASLNEEIASRSLTHVDNSMKLSLLLERPIYSFHAGFLIDPKVTELGKTIKNKTLFDRDTALNKFISRVNLIANKAKEYGISLLIENNVLSSNNLKQFGTDPFLMTTHEECIDVMEKTSNNVNLLIDVAHLKVSAKSLGFSKMEFLEKVNPWIHAYHFSDNDGQRDTNNCIAKDSWFWKYIKLDLNYYSLEVYNESIETILNQVSLVKEKIGYTCK
tara:strand:- start:1157 stop:2023 length:867 start_codon:yes stop_codon:yes gene_type:complete